MEVFGWLLKKLEAMSAIVVALIALWALFAGFFVPFTSIPPYWRWFYYINPMAYAFAAVVNNQFGSGATEGPSLVDMGTSALKNYLATGRMADYG